MRLVHTLMMGVMLMSGLPVAFGASAEETAPPGAAKFWTSEHPVIVEARALIDAGEFAKAEHLLLDGKGFGANADRSARDESLETIRRVRREFSQSEQQLVEAVRRSIEDFNAEDLRRLTRQGHVVHRVIDGEVCYYRREPGVMRRFCDEIKQRMADWDRRRRESGTAAAAAPGPPLDEDRGNFTLNRHLARVAEAGSAAHEAGRSPIVEPMRFRMRYTLTVKPANQQLAPGLMREGSTLAVWLPFPQEYRQQSDVRLAGATIDGEPYQPTIAPNATGFDGPDPIGGAPQRTAYFEMTVRDPHSPITFEEIFEYTMAGHYPVITAENTHDLTDEQRSAFSAYLAQRPPHVVFTPELADRARGLVGDEANPYLKAKAIFDWWDANVRWLPEFEYATIPSFTKLCMQRKRGDCGVQAATLIAMMRVVGVPARWQSGFITAPGQENLHDWAEVYLPPHGWVVADPSFGYRDSDNPLVRHFYLGHMDAYRLIVNLDYGRPLHPPKKSLRSEPADFQRGEVEVDGTNLYFDDWSWDFDVVAVGSVQ